MELETLRFMLRDFSSDDLHGFLRYQMDPRYRALYGLPEGDNSHAIALFSRFLEWQQEIPRYNYQLGIFDKSDGRLCGCGGVRQDSSDLAVAVLGLELAPEDWGRYRVAIEVGERLAEFAFETLGVHRLVSDTSSGNTRVAKIAQRYGATLIAQRPGPSWMTSRGWHEVDWCLPREQWEALVTQRKSRPAAANASKSENK